MQSLLLAIREAASPSLWSQGVQLVRSHAVSLAAGASISAQEIDLQVKPRQGNVMAHVTLWPEDDEWSCQCDAAVDPCLHAIAAAIALGQARQGKMLLGSSLASCHVAYHFFRTPGGLTLERMIAGGETPLPLAVPLAVRLRAPGPTLATQAHDGLIDSLVADRPQLGQVPLGRALMGRVLSALVGMPHVFLDDQPVEVGEALAPWTLHIQRRQHDALLVQVQPTQGIVEMFANGAARTKHALCPLLEEGMGRYERAKWQTPQLISAQEGPRFMGTVWPELSRRMPVQWQDMEAPQQDTALKATVSIALSLKEGDHLSVVASVIYGNPPQARLVQKELRLLGTSLPRRNVKKEAELEELIEERLGLRPNIAKELRGSDAAAFRKLVVAQAQSLGWQLSEPEDAAALLAIHAPVSAHLESHGDHVDVIFGSTEHRGTATAAAVLKAFSAGDDLVAMEGGGFAPLPKTWLAQHSEAVALLVDAKQGDPMEHKNQGMLRQIALFDLLDSAKTPVEGHLPDWTRQRLRIETADLAEPEAFLAPGVELRGYQSDGIAWLRSRQRLELGALLADDMGLGKTLQALAVIQGKSLVVAPSSVLFNWQQEAARFRPDQKVCVYMGSRRELDPQATMTLTSFDVLRLDRATLASCVWDMVVVDEAHRLKNADSQSAMAARQLQGRWRLMLTGTPVENRLDELWSLMAFLNPGLLGERSTFASNIVAPISAGDAHARQRLQARVGPCMLRRTKKQVLPSLPRRTDLISYCELDSEERVAYEAVMAHTRQDVLTKLGVKGQTIRMLEALLRLRQASCHRGLLPGHNAPTSSKLRLLMAKLTEVLAEDHKALVFSQWTQLLDRVEPLLRAAGHHFARLDGNTVSRQSVVADFMADEGPPILLASLKAGGVGLNLTAADHVFLLDPWWNPAAEDQAADRAHRIGQTRPVFVHRLVAAKTVEEKIMALQQKKRAMADALLDDATSEISLESEELLELFAE